MTSDVANDSLISSLWRRKWIVLATVLLFAGVAAVISKSLPKEYETSLELLIVQEGDDQNFDAVQAAQVSARTYGNIVTSPNVAGLVLARTELPFSASELTDKISAEPIPETQLLQVTLTDGDARRVKRIGDVYADTFVEYVRRNLTPATGVSVSIADRAAVPQGPVRPKPTLYVLLASLIGAGVGIALALLRDRSDARLRSAEQIESEFNVPIIARITSKGRKDLDQQAFTEAFRSMRSNLQFMHYAQPVRTIAFTSANPGEGKSTTVGELALALGSSGGQALAVEADVRRPSLQPMLIPDEPRPLQPGLTTFIVGSRELDDVVYETRVPSVSLVPAGPGVPTLSGLLQSERGSQVVARLAARAPLVLFDLPPLSAGADAITVVARTDAVILVIDLETATRASIGDSLRQLEAVRANVLGFVINRDPDVNTVPYGYDDIKAPTGRAPLPAAR